jgi:hypothetical protein
MNRIRMSAGLIAIAGSTIFANGAHAGPYAGEFNSAVASIALSGSDRATYSIGLSLQASSPASSASFATLTVSVARCTALACGASLSYATRLSSANYSIAPDLSSASATTKLFGKSLVVHWTSADAAPTFSNANLRVPADETFDDSKAATASVGILGQSCNDNAAQLTLNVQVDAAGGASSASGPANPTQPPAGLRAHGKYRPRCTATPAR